MSSVSKPRVRHNRHKQGLNLTLEKLSADFRYYTTPAYNGTTMTAQAIYRGELSADGKSITWESTPVVQTTIVHNLLCLR